MSKIIETIKALPNLISIGRATSTQIKEAETKLQLKFATEYKEYLSSFSAITADGIELSGLCKSKNRDVVLLTEREWNNNSKIPHNMYVIENTGIDGINIWQDENGSIYKTSYDSKPKKIATSLADYISNSTSNTQNENYIIGESNIFKNIRFI